MTHQRAEGGQDLGAAPAVSIILPTYNRAPFLPQALESIRAQHLVDWELIVIDDGSTDNTRELVAELTQGCPQPVRYVHQQNLGPYGARNTGLDLARGGYIAFFDSDDLWLPHHLSNCALALDENPHVTWVFGASRIVDPSGTVVEPNSFYRQGRPKDFLKLSTRRRGSLNIIDDRRVTIYAIEYGLAGGLQNSMIRRGFFESYRFTAVTRNETEDQLATIVALARGNIIGYYDNVHVIYNVHDGNSSGAGPFSLERHIRISRAMVDGFEQFGRQTDLSRSQRCALRRRLSRDYFWNLGYMLSRQPENQGEALAMLRHGLSLWCWDIGMWKCYVFTRLRLAFPTRLRQGSGAMSRD